jgi:O-antigen/teichoic acid export membrane protein
MTVHSPPSGSDRGASVGPAVNSLPRLLANTLALLATQLLQPLFSVILVIAISRYLGPSGLGQYSFILTYVAIFAPLAEFGLHEIITREIAKDPARVGRYFPTVFLLGTLATALCVIAMSVIVSLLHYPQEILSAVYLMAPYVLCSTLIGYAFAFFQAFERLKQTALISLGETAFRVGASLLFLALGGEVLGLIALLVVGRVLSLASMLFLLRRVIGRIHYTIDLSLAQSLLPQAATFCATSLVFILYWRVDLLMLTQMSGLAVAGHYAAAYRIFDVCTFLFNSYISAYYPQQARAYAKSLAGFESSAMKSVKFLSMVSLPLAMGFNVVADQMILLLYGSTFQGSIVVLQILMWSIVPFAILRVYSICLVSSLNQTFDFVSNLLVLLLNVGINLLLIPGSGAVGASIATLVSLCVFLIIQHLFIWRRLFRVPLLALLWKPVLSTAIMGVVIFPLRTTGLYSVLPLAAAIYVVVLLALRPFSADERGAILELWRDFSKRILKEAPAVNSEP